MGNRYYQINVIRGLDLDSDQQLKLFTTGEIKSLTAPGARRSISLQMDSDFLQRWKGQIIKHQQMQRISRPVAQGTLFNLASPTTDPETIDPLDLPLHSFSFFRLPSDGKGDNCL
ncbi:MAG: hypothetical protein JO235_09905 [Chroococcidiopsidaceae cyanobacterium CP_BM_RX_35]|nr:hypothetical protein [Chroococcidiopsidaceae cyanobacterium CP_BM_RX_35]